MLSPLVLFLLMASPLIVTANASSAPAATISGNTKPLHFTSPIQSFTIFDKSALSSPDYASPRRKFLPRFRAGLVAERRAREALAEEQRKGILDFDDGQVESGDGSGWAEASAAADERKKKVMEERVEAAFDAAVKEYDERMAARKKILPASSSSGKYQFVGVVNNGTRNARNNAVTWFARKKPKRSKWNVRLVHVNRDAVLRELFVRGKVDVYGKYINEGLDKAAFEAADKSGQNVDDRVAMKPCVKAQYLIKERSWKTLWNFSPKRMLTLPSGSFWRERRIDPGLYTDGTTVYEAVYRYRDGKNGMKPVTKLSNLLSSPGLGNEEKLRIVERLKGGDIPDVVVEK